MAKVLCEWLTAEVTKESGVKVKCMVEESTNGQQANNTKAHTKWI